MNPRYEAAWEMHRFLTNHRIPYVIIGGIAVQKWSDPRFTKDVDLTITSSLTEGSASLVHLITTHFPSRIPDPVEFARRNRLILITASNGTEVDISLALPGYEDELLARAVNFEIEPDKRIRLCSAEDLVIHKAVAGRPQDVIDIQGVVYRQGTILDLAYIRSWLNQYADALDNSEVRERFESAWRRYHDE